MRTSHEGMDCEVFESHEPRKKLDIVSAREGRKEGKICPVEVFVEGRRTSAGREGEKIEREGDNQAPRVVEMQVSSSEGGGKERDRKKDRCHT
ncbi:hypothetical protein Pmani_021422 [Petrolisthes manimaculis]|uniref:Uncharacterized protein n=1 Tax=Petrolisthes manimaculis TaxID=1843537 RepID=A0AAE1PG87_9EUCA|nr:hypothetical protein Pmani_021422 [Petrolisthes manimaculis]